MTGGKITAVTSACLVAIADARPEFRRRAGEVFADGPKERAAVSEPRHQAYLIDRELCLAQKVR